jgi:hypothetical protein
VVIRFERQQELCLVPSSLDIRTHTLCRALTWLSRQGPKWRDKGDVVATSR